MEKSELIIELEAERCKLQCEIFNALPNSDKLYNACRRIVEIFDTIHCLNADV